MNIQAEKLSIIQQLLVVQDERLLTAIQNLLQYAVRYPGASLDRYEDLPSAVRESIEISIQELNAGKGVSHQKVMAELKAQFLS